MFNELTLEVFSERSGNHCRTCYRSVVFSAFDLILALLTNITMWCCHKLLPILHFWLPVQPSKNLPFMIIDMLPLCKHVRSSLHASLWLLRPRRLVIQLFSWLWGGMGKGTYVVSRSKLRYSIFYVLQDTTKLLHNFHKCYITIPTHFVHVLTNKGTCIVIFLTVEDK